LRARQIINFDHDWRFLKADASGAENSEFNDSDWRKLAVPHDWSIEGPFSETNKTGGAGGFLPSGIGWYRKHFSLPETDSDRRVSVEFDGVMANSDVWINGHHLGKRPYGYVSFSYELTPYLNFGARPNVIAVRADNSQQPASRWYAGAGIYRHVRLVVTDPVHIKQWGTFVTTPQVSADEAVVHIESTVTNQSDSSREISVRFSLRDPDGKFAGNAETKTQVVPAGQSATFTQEISVENPQRWSLESPALYQVNSEVRAGNEIFDDEKTPFGIRHFEFRSDTGFWLNGKNFKIYGVCLHSEASAFGAAVPLGVWERRLSELKKLGVNAIRTAHNPPAPEFLDLCDRMGFLVMDEFFDCWTVAKNPYDYHLYFDEWSKTDARDTILRDRNHPSIILYSVGNEIHDTPKAELAKRILKGLVEVCHENDPTRPVTQALFRPNVSHDYDDGLADMLDVIGTNYRDNELLAAQREKPSRKIIGTEQRQDRQTWLWLRDNPSHSGQFLWSGIDYLGESRRWPVVAAGSGLLERTATPRPIAFERQSWWSEKPMVFMTRRAARSAEIPADPGFSPLDRRQVLFPDWTPRDTTPHLENVEVYSNCGEVELFLNGKSLGAKTINADASPRHWEVPFEPGTLKAVGKNDGKAVAEFELRTAGKPAKIILKTESKTLAPGFDNVAFARAEVVDENGILIPHANDLITFDISGPGKIAAVDSANNASHESFQATQRRAFQGRCFAILKATGATGKIILTASAPGLKSSSITIPTTRAGE
jgi:beta-galactosidase